jgi:two-component system, OmpR family, alkaline phosphatase synthesis response regulator PhoP
VATILAVDKDPLNLNLLGFLLRENGHKVYVTAEPDTALSLIRSQRIDLVILEIALQRHDGIRVCQQVRQLDPYIPLLIVTERRDEEDMVQTLMIAADDYLTKPYSPRPLLARIHALLRRCALNRDGRWVEEDVSVGEISLNLQQMHAVVNGHHVRLTPREFTLLHCLMQNAGRVLSRDQLMRLSWGENFVGTAKSVDVNVQRLRMKISPYLTDGFCIQAHRGFGYKFEAAQPAPVVALN